jgi:hypothetical protein
MATAATTTATAVGAVTSDQQTHLQQIAKHFHGKEDKLNVILRQQYSGDAASATTVLCGSESPQMPAGIFQRNDGSYFADC